MNARSKFVPLTSGLFRQRVTEDITDRRGKVRTIKFYTGVNKGKVYRYASKRQLSRQQRMAPEAYVRNGTELMAYLNGN